GGDCGKQIKPEKEQEVEARRKNGGGKNFEERDHRRVEIVAIGSRREDFDNREEKDQVNRGFKKGARKEEIIDRIEPDVRNSGDEREAIGDLKTEKAGDDQAAKDEAEAGQQDGRCVQIAGSGDREIAAGDQSE